MLILKRFNLCAVSAILIAASVTPTFADLTPDDLRTLSLELGITPASITALGLGLTAAQDAMERLESEDELAASLRTAQAQAGQLAAQLRVKQREARTADTVALAQAAESAAEEIESQMVTLAASIATKRGQLRASFMPTGTDMTAASLVLAPDPGASALPVEYRVLDLSAADAKSLATALASLRRSQARELPVDAEAQQLVNQYRNLPAVSTARAGMVAWMASVEQLFFQWE